LIELLAIMAIVSILAAVALPALSQAKRCAKSAGCKSRALDKAGGKALTH
jgi:type II secretory pathway pseudopilin PulG